MLLIGKRFTKEPLQSLAGTKKRSFKMPFGNAEIWFEHLDGMYQYTDAARQKLELDSAEFLRPSYPALIAFNLDETRADQALIERIAFLVTGCEKRFTRVTFTGLDAKARHSVKKRLKNSGTAFAFINDFEAAKRWLVGKPN